ncbi:MAG: HD domain-containing protein, partial [Lachnospiraceae bacterium]|nr:HD domain-containing protein [Lachnospiraceae bacterium]
FSKKEYLKILKKTMKENTYYVSDEVTGEDVGDVRLSFVLLYRALIARIPADEIYVPSLSLHEGMVCEYAYEKRLMAVPRDFDEDIFSSSWAIAAHYNRYPQNLETLKRLSEQLFDAIRKRHGLSERSRLLLSVAAILHDCGKYISLANEAKCTYTIITSSEILGLSEKEREMIALICYFFKEGTGSYEECSGSLTREEYFSVVKLAAIMSLAASLDLNHMSSFDALRFRYNDRDELSVTIDTQDSLAMEQGIFSERAAAFEDVFAIRPVLRTQRIRGNNG